MCAVVWSIQCVEGAEGELLNKTHDNINFSYHDNLIKGERDSVS